MKELNATELRELINLLAPLRSLKETAEKNVHLELFQGTGDLTVRSYRGLRGRALKILDDPYLEALEVDVRENTTEQEKVSQAILAAGQLLAYLEAITGVRGAAETHTQIQTAPHIIIQTRGTPDAQQKQILDMVGRMLEEDDEQAEAAGGE
jgi:hypothetical protein